MSARQVYVDHMYQLGYGLRLSAALWDPEPRNDEVQIGDLGFVTPAGSFAVIFNVTKSADEQPYKVPEGFEPLQLDSRWLKSVPYELRSGYLASGVHKAISIGAGLQCDPLGIGVIQAGGDLDLSFDLADAGLLILKQSASRLDALQEGHFIRYIKNNHRSWYTFARDTVGLPVGNRDLILVTGHHKTSSWALAAYSNKSYKVKLSFTGSVTMLSDGEFSLSGRWKRMPIQQAKDGPTSRTIENDEASSQDPGPANQCVFVRGFKIGSKLFSWPKKIKAAAGAHDSSPQLPIQPDSGVGSMEVDSDSDSDSESSVYIEPIPQEDAPGHPLDALLDYAMKSTELDVAIVHDADLASMKADKVDYTSLYAQLVSTRPRIFKDGGVATFRRYEAYEEPVTRVSRQITRQKEIELKEIPQNAQLLTTDERALLRAARVQKSTAATSSRDSRSETETAPQWTSPGLRVGFWGENGSYQVGTVTSTKTTADGTKLVNVKVDSQEKELCLPVSGISPIAPSLLAEDAKSSSSSSEDFQGNKSPPSSSSIVEGNATEVPGAWPDSDEDDSTGWHGQGPAW